MPPHRGAVQKDQLVEGLFPQSGRTLAWFLRRGSGKLTLVPASIALPIFPSLLAACLVLLVGGLLAQRVPLLVRYSIPAPIVGGLIFAVLALLAERTTGLGMTFDTSAKTPFLLLFFASIGLTADLAVLRRGGARLLRSQDMAAANLCRDSLGRDRGDPSSARQPEVSVRVSSANDDVSRCASCTIRIDLSQAMLTGRDHAIRGLLVRSRMPESGYACSVADGRPQV